MLLEVRHFEMLRSIADEGSITGAARRLHVSQPALSRTLGDLEERVGLTLFHRGSRRMNPTPACRKLLFAADQVLGIVSAAEERLKLTASGTVASIRITTECYTCYRWLPAIIEEFRASFPDVTIDIDTDNAGRPLEAIEEGLIDLGIVYTVPPDTRLTAHPLFEDELVLVVPPGDVLSERSTVTAEDFSGRHLIVYSEKGSDVMNQLLIPSGIRPDRISSIQITDGILDLVKAGLGISVVAEWAAADDVSAGKLVAIPIEGGLFVRQWQAVATPETMNLPHVRRFVELLQDNRRLFCALRD